MERELALGASPFATSIVESPTPTPSMLRIICMTSAMMAPENTAPQDTWFNIIVRTSSSGATTLACGGFRCSLVRASSGEAICLRLFQLETLRVTSFFQRRSLSCWNSEWRILSSRFEGADFSSGVQGNVSPGCSPSGTIVAAGPLGSRSHQENEMRDKQPASVDAVASDVTRRRAIFRMALATAGLATAAYVAPVVVRIDE